MARSNVTAIASVKASAPVATTSAPASGLAALCDALDASFPERHSVIRAVARAFLAGEHVFILGEPGTGKSLLIRCFSQALGLSYWECLMGRFTTPEALFGPLSIPGLQNDRFTRAWQNYMPAFQVVFLDEIWKCNPGCLNTLLSITNERVFHDDGKAIRCPLNTMVTASNELPESESELGAIYDRCAVRLVTEYIADREAFKGLISRPTPTVPAVSIDFAAEQAACRAVTVPDDVMEALVDLRFSVRDAGFKVSDRKWRACVGLVKASAHLEGRTEATKDDLDCLEDVLWRAPEERTAISQLIQKIANPAAAKAVEDLDNARKLVAGLPTLDMADPKAFSLAAPGVNKDLSDIAARLAKYPAGKKVAEAIKEVEVLRKRVRVQSIRAAGLPVDDE
ncbi:MAG TPA: AAA family ATPase [Caulobacteraceae bacterium]|nr:AAA family ATPase [Caulobacteraceae bacterium]